MTGSIIMVVYYFLCAVPINISIGTNLIWNFILEQYGSCNIISQHTLSVILGIAGIILFLILTVLFLGSGEINVGWILGGIGIPLAIWCVAELIVAFSIIFGLFFFLIAFGLFSQFSD